MFFQYRIRGCVEMQLVYHLPGVSYNHEADSNADVMALSRNFMAKNVHQQAAPEIGLT